MGRSLQPQRFARTYPEEERDIHIKLYHNVRLFAAESSMPVCCTGVDRHGSKKTARGARSRNHIKELREKSL